MIPTWMPLGVPIQRHLGTALRDAETAVAVHSGLVRDLAQETHVALVPVALRLSESRHNLVKGGRFFSSRAASSPGDTVMEISSDKGGRGPQRR